MKTTLSLMLLASVAMAESDHLNTRGLNDIENDGEPDNCNHDEVYNQLGPHRCENDNDCTGWRYCSAWGWCTG